MFWVAVLLNVGRLFASWELKFSQRRTSPDDLSD